MGSAMPAEARRMANGTMVYDQFIHPDHPATKAGPRVSVELLRRYGDEFDTEHCYLLKRDGAVGNVTLESLYAVAHGAFSADVFKGEISEDTLAEIRGQNIEFAADRFVDYALAKARNNPVEAARIVKGAEQSDAKCVAQIARYWRTQVDLLPQDMRIMLDYDGKWVVAELNPGAGMRNLPLTVRIVGRVEAISEMITRGYAHAYQLLSARGTVVAESTEPKALPPSRSHGEAKPQTGPGEAKVATSMPPAATPTVVSEMRNATAELSATLAHARKFCMLKASVSDCS